MARRKNVRLDQIAEAVGVSVVTVSNALNDRKGVSEELRIKIKDAAERMGYRKTEAERPASKKAYIIGVVVAERYVKEFPSFYMDIYKRVAQEAAKRGSMTILEVVDEQKESLKQEFTAFQGIKISGIILIGEMNKAYVRKTVEIHEVPIVGVDFYDVQEELDYIITDSYGGMEQMTELLLASGCENIAFVGTPCATGNIMDRYLGFLKAMDKWGKPVGKNQVIPDRSENWYEYQIDVKLPKKLPDGFVCNCDKTARIVLEKLAERGVKIPDEVSVVSFDHYYSETQNGIRLTTYENDEKVIARISVSTLIKRIEGRKAPSGGRIVEGKVVLGNTVRRSEEGKE